MARRKRGGAHGGHGWFVTFADLMALLMSFFVMVAAYSTQDQKKLQLVAGSMRDAFGMSKDSRFAGITELDGLPAADHLKNLRDIPPTRRPIGPRPRLRTRVPSRA
jgi:chemotaxis protein MotB